MYEYRRYRKSDVCSKTSMDDTLNLNFSRSNLISTTYNVIHDVEQFIRENIADIMFVKKHHKR